MSKFFVCNLSARTVVISVESSAETLSARHESCFMSLRAFKNVVKRQMNAIQQIPVRLFFGSRSIFRLEASSRHEPTPSVHFRLSGIILSILMLQFMNKQSSGGTSNKADVFRQSWRARSSGGLDWHHREICSNALIVLITCRFAIRVREEREACRRADQP